MSRALIIFNTAADRQKAIAWAGKAPWGTRVEWKAPKRTLDQNSRFWALLTDVASQVEHAGNKYSTEEWKLLFMHAWGREVRFLPGLDQKSVVPVGQSSSDLSKEEMGDLMEFISAWGAEHGVVFHDPQAHQSSDAAPASPAEMSDEAATLPDPSGVAATLSNAPGTPAIPEQGDSGSVDPADHSAAATQAGEVANVGLSASPAAELECIRKLLAIVADPALDQKEKAQTIAEAADVWLGALGPERRDFVTSVFTTSKKVLRGEMQAEPARRYLEGLAA